MRTLVFWFFSATLLLPVPAAAQFFTDDFERSGPEMVHRYEGAWTATEGVLRSTQTGCCGSPWQQGAAWVSLGDPTWSDLRVTFRLRAYGGRAQFAFLSHWEPGTGQAGFGGYALMPVFVFEQSESQIACGAYDYSCSDLRGTCGDFVPDIGQWHDVEANVSPESLVVFVDGARFAWFSPPCARSTGTIGFGHARDDATVEIDDLRIDVLNGPVQSSSATWGRVKALHR